MENNKNFYAVIMAGGTGSRLWPLSRKDKPKQFHKFTSSDKTMIQETYERASKVVPKENILVSTTESYKSLVKEQIPEISDSQLIIEPMARGTAPAIALVAKYVFSLNPEAVVATIASDHAIKNVEEFVASLDTALSTIEKHPEKLMTVGINPTFPDTGLGYIKMGKEFLNSNNRRVFFVDAFKEKPDRKTAEEYLTNWEYFWNAGYFIFSAKTFLEWVKDLTPKISEVLEIIGKEWEIQKGSVNSKIEEAYKSLENDAVEFAIVEKLDAETRLVIPTELKWSDVGNWGSLFDFYEDSLESPMIVKGNHIDSGSQKCFIHGSDKLIATIGLENIIIVETEDAILIADRKKVSDVKKIIDKLKEEGKHLYL
ncbi:MAG: mannose-1-phosphate guanylyltransferase [Patescibacteria group bacterium]